ncbi:UNVERIFIED_CONTAM: hypothetical protein Slati_2187600 [Sesamum latifolium]|uniref:Integrase zinc-binding domain-containing protein n=1 Tax=Sesamum latifolium TaxID=2727402 RepID=A0AAW2WRI6_9LAMI
MVPTYFFLTPVDLLDSVTHLLKDILAVLHHFITVFNPVLGHPPSRPHDHRIHLSPDSTPVNIKPYRYRHCHKESMSILIFDMLRDGLIRPNTSPFSSPVLSVKKKDGLGFHYEIQYKPGKENVVVDALSRISAPAKFTVISSPTANISLQLQDFFTSTPAGRWFLATLQAGTAPSCHFSYRTGLVFHRQHVFVPPESHLGPSLIGEFHSTPFEGHSGAKATLARLSATFYWPHMASDVKRFLAECSTCQYNKYDPNSHMVSFILFQFLTKVWDNILWTSLLICPILRGLHYSLVSKFAISVAFQLASLPLP